MKPMSHIAMIALVAILGTGCAEALLITAYTYSQTQNKGRNGGADSVVNRNGGNQRPKIDIDMPNPDEDEDKDGDGGGKDGQVLSATERFAACTGLAIEEVAYLGESLEVDNFCQALDAIAFLDGINWTQMVIDID